MSLQNIPTREQIVEAHNRIKPYINRTPLLTNDSINTLCGATVWFKCENLQQIGAFKMRGAMNAALSLPAELLNRGLATHSSGNHAQALARAAKLLGVPAYIVMPRTAPEVKKNGVRKFGGEITECEPTLAAREETLARVMERTGATEIHPFNNYDVMAGQATAALEVYEELRPDYLIAPVGGGGLLSGSAVATSCFSAGTIVIGAEPEGSDDAYRSMQSGKIEPAQSQSIADGLLTTLGDKTFPVIKSRVSEIITVSDKEIIEALRLVWENLKVIAEPSCAVVLAAVLKRPEQFRGKTVAVILSGGNVDLVRILDLFKNL
ncbi:MAG: pyridoxal-phosphate dependent enzyme [Bacteroidetes bacterium]|nr:pyridoxal-phosphate dependent enzyme [Bacteroidota bacterium]